MLGTRVGSTGLGLVSPQRPLLAELLDSAFGAVP